MRATAATLLHLLALLWLLAPIGSAVADGRLEPDPVFGGTVYVEEAGNPSKPTVVLVHGLGAAGMDDWRAVIERLKPDYRVLAFDLPGFGRSSGGSDDYTPTRYAQMLRLLVRRHSTGPVHLVGHSMGGAIALRFAASYPDGVRTLTLAGAAGILHQAAYGKSLAALGLEQLTGIRFAGDGALSDLVGVLLDDAQQRLPVDPGLLMQIRPLRRKVLNGNPTALAAYGLAEEDFSHAPQRVTAPTLIVWGEQDQVSPLRTGRVLDALIPRSYLRVLPGAGHMTIADQPERFVATLRPLLDGTLDPALLERQAAPIVAHPDRARSGRIRCSGQRGQVYSGPIDRLVLKGCTDVMVRNAAIGGLEIEDSDVRIENSRILADDVAIVARGSTIYLTLGRVEGQVAIQSKASRFDIAGTELIGRRAVVESVADSSFVFSLGDIRSPNWADDVIHGYWLLGSGQRL